VMRREGGREDAKLPWQKAWKRRRSLIARRSSSLDSGNPPEKAGDLFYACVKKRGEGGETRGEEWRPRYIGRVCRACRSVRSGGKGREMREAERVGRA
jgi:hypothetical protein